MQIDQPNTSSNELSETSRVARLVLLWTFLLIGAYALKTTLFGV